MHRAHAFHTHPPHTPIMHTFHTHNTPYTHPSHRPYTHIPRTNSTHSFHTLSTYWLNRPPHTHTQTHWELGIFEIKNITCIHCTLNDSLVLGLGTFVNHFTCKAAITLIPMLSGTELLPTCCRGKMKVLGPLVQKRHIRYPWSLVIQKYSSKKRKEFDYCEFCSILFLPDNNLPLQSNNNLNTNRHEAFQKVMNSEASEPRRSWFKCMTPAAQRGYQLYSRPGRKNNISKSHCQKGKENEENATEIKPFRAFCSKRVTEKRGVAKSCQRQLSQHGEDRRDGSYLSSRSHTSPSFSGTLEHVNYYIANWKIICRHFWEPKTTYHQSIPSH